jgi:DNA primase
LARTIPDDTIRRIKNVANIVEIVGESVVLKKSGRNYLGLCPFHAEKTPSFTVSPEKQIFYCFGCHTGGNVFSFVMQQEGLAFPESVRSLASRFGIEVPDHSMTPERKRQQSEKDKLYRINEIALAFFRSTLRDSKLGQKAMTYLLGRGMTRKVIDAHQLGYAPSGWDGLSRHLQHKKVPRDLFEKSGLIIPRKEGNGHYDRFRERVIFPILNLNQQVIGFGGRVMDQSMPKYMNSPETTIYNKSRSLYGIHLAKKTARSTDTIYVVEGYFDVLAMHLNGIENCVATLGTALTVEHVQLLKGMVGANGRVVLVYDSDQAGIKAAQRSISVFEQGFLDAHILVLPKGYDPDDFLRDHGPDQLMKAAEKAKGMVPFLIDSAIQEHGLALEGKVKVVASLQQPLAAVTDTIARSLYIKQLAERLDIDESVLMEKIRRTEVKDRSHAMVDRRGPDTGPVKESLRLEQQIVAMMLRHPAMISEIVGRNLLDYFEDATLREIALMAAQHTEDDKSRAADLVSMINDPGYRSLMAKLAIDDQLWDRQGCERLLTQFEGRHQRQVKLKLRREIEAAEKNNDMDLLLKLLQQKQKQAGNE